MTFQLQQPAKGVGYHWIKILKNSQYGRFNGSFPGSILEKMMPFLLDRAEQSDRFVPPRRKLLVKHFPHKFNVVLPVEQAGEALEWCITQQRDAFSMRSSLTSGVEFILSSRAAQVYMKTAFA